MAALRSRSRGARPSGRSCVPVANRLQADGGAPTKHWRIVEYRTANGRNPFRRWLSSLRNEVAVRRIVARILRLEHGNRGDWKGVGGGVCELRIDYGPGYRVYFAVDGATLVLLLCGGDKSSQAKDIGEAHAYWKDWKAIRS